MRIAFSNACCPEWKLGEQFRHAEALGYEAIELDAGLEPLSQLEQHPGLSADLAADIKPETDIARIICCLASNVELCQPLSGDTKAMLRSCMDLSAQLDCPQIQVCTGSPRRGTTRQGALEQVVSNLKALIPDATRLGIHLVIENTGTLSQSRDLWFVLDALSHESVGACWNHINGFLAGDRPTVAIPRLGRHLRMVHLADMLTRDVPSPTWVPIGQGHTETERAVMLLRGIGYHGYVVVRHPAATDSLDSPESWLQEAARYLKSLIHKEQVPLSAYKDDQTAPTFTRSASELP